MAGAVRSLTRHVQPVEPGHRDLPSSLSAAGRRQPSNRRVLAIALLATLGIAIHLLLRFAFHAAPLVSLAPLYAVLLLGGSPLVFALVRRLAAREFGSDLLAGISILTSVLQGEYLVGSIVVLMLSGGTALEEFASRRASSSLDTLANRMPQTTHRRAGAQTVDVTLDQVRVGDILLIYPHEVCPADGVVVEGHGRMNEAFLTGEPFEVSKAPGSKVISGALNGETALTIRSEKLPGDSRYARIMRVMEDTQQRRPRLRRLGDQLGAWYTPARAADCTPGVGGQRRAAPLPGSIGYCDTVPAADRDSCGRHRGDCALGAFRHHHQESCDSGAD